MIFYISFGSTHPTKCVELQNPFYFVHEFKNSIVEAYFSRSIRKRHEFRIFVANWIHSYLVWFYIVASKQFFLIAFKIFNLFCFIVWGNNAIKHLLHFNQIMQFSLTFCCEQEKYKEFSSICYKEVSFCFFDSYTIFSSIWHLKKIQILLLSLFHVFFYTTEAHLKRVTKEQ